MIYERDDHPHTRDNGEAEAKDAKGLSDATAHAVAQLLLCPQHIVAGLIHDLHGPEASRHSVVEAKTVNIPTNAKFGTHLTQHTLSSAS